MSREEIKRAMQLLLSVPLTSSLSCFFCRKETIVGSRKLMSCKCKVCVYCSQECMEKDYVSHHTRCGKIKQLAKDIRSKTKSFRRAYLRGNDFVDLFQRTNAYRMVDGRRVVDCSKQFCTERKELLDKRELLIQELLHEGSRKGGGAAEYTNLNVYAYGIAAQQSLDLELLQRKRTWERDWEKDDAELAHLIL